MRMRLAGLLFLGWIFLFVGQSHLLALSKQSDYAKAVFRIDASACKGNLTRRVNFIVGKGDPEEIGVLRSRPRLSRVQEYLLRIEGQIREQSHFRLITLLSLCTDCALIS